MPFDIAMPFHGRLDHLQAAVRSVLAQDDADLRLVVVDDAYPSLEPYEWLRSLDDERLVVERNDVNVGVSGSFQRAADTARGEFVCIMGCDDVMLPGYVGRMRELLATHPDADIVQPGVRVIDGDGAPVQPLADRVKRAIMPRGPRPVRLVGEALATSIARGNWCYFPSVTWRVERIRRIGFRTDLQIVQDVAMMLAIAREGGSLLLDDREVFAYRRHGGSVSMTGVVDGTRFAQERTILEEEATAFDALGWRRAARMARLRPTSRMNAALGLPTAALRRDGDGIRVLAAHTFGGGTAR